MKEEKKKFQKNSREKGITLVALVITIIIIIILATVTINMAFGDNGLIKQAELARNMAANSTTFEEESMANLTAYMNDLMEEDTNSDNTLVQAFKRGDILVGDYVNYKPSEVKSVTVGTEKTGYTDSEGISGGTDQSFTTDMSTTWQVLGLSEDGQHLLLISGSPIKKTGEDPYLILEGAKGYLYCESTLDEIAGIYHNSSLAEETRSIKIEDIENVLGGVTVEYPTEGNIGTGKVYLTSDSSKILGATTTYPSYTYNENNFSPESAIQNPPQHATVGTKVNADAYYFIYDYEGYQELGIDISQKAYNMLFAGTTEEDKYAKSYWLASSGIGASETNSNFSPGFVGDGVFLGGYDIFSIDGDISFNSSGVWYAGGFAVRPVVVLKSDITVDQVQVIEEQTEATWNTKGGQEYGSGYTQ